MMNNLMIRQNSLAERLPAMFAKMLAHGSLHCPWAKLIRQSFHLIETLKIRLVEASHNAGIKTVSIDRISVSRALGKAIYAEGTTMLLRQPNWMR